MPEILSLLPPLTPSYSTESSFLIAQHIRPNNHNANNRSTRFCLDDLLMPLDSIMIKMPTVVVSESIWFYLQQGQAVQMSNVPASGLVRLADQQERFLGVGEIDDDGKVAPKRLLAHKATTAEK